ncbi:MAG: pyridoxamine 5'-phosphate oxidase family protein [Thermostichus sp. BF3_bins_97]
MAKVHDSITPALQQFIAAQQIFFVATAPLAANGHVNLSPKGLQSFRLLSPHQVAYLDLTGSGNETSAHLAENQRITLMFCAFEDPPCILRLYGRGQVILPDSREWKTWIPQFDVVPGARQIIWVEVERVQTSCGMGVPLYAYRGQRQSLVQWAATKGEAGLQAYQHQKNQLSIDGLPTPLSLHRQSSFTKE